jgi:PPOX class F420-dependent enzyme/OxyR family protein
MLTPEERDYLQTQRLARLATVAPDGQPTIDAVGFTFEGGRFYIGGHNLPGTRKYRTVDAGNRRVALIIDDLASVQPWTPRGIWPTIPASTAWGHWRAASPLRAGTSTGDARSRRRRSGWRCADCLLHAKCTQGGG